VKVFGLESVVNITIDLLVIRTTVDHGTAFNIVDTGKADERSMLEAMRARLSISLPVTPGHERCLVMSPDKPLCAG